MMPTPNGRPSAPTRPVSSRSPLEVRVAALQAAATFAGGKALRTEVSTQDVLKVAAAFERWLLGQERGAMADLIPWPLPLPDRFLDALGYPRVVEAFDSPAMRARLADLLRRQGIAEPQPLPTGPRRYVMLHWEPAGDELAFSDGVHSGAGQLDHWVWLDYLHGRTPGVPPPVLGPIVAWLVEHQVDLGSSDAPATHALVVDTHSLDAHVAPIALARRIVRAQALGQDPQP